MLFEISHDVRNTTDIGVATERHTLIGIWAISTRRHKICVRSFAVAIFLFSTNGNSPALLEQIAPPAAWYRVNWGGMHWRRWWSECVIGLDVGDYGAYVTIVRATEPLTLKLVDSSELLQRFANPFDKQNEEMEDWARQDIWSLLIAVSCSSDLQIPLINKTSTEIGIFPSSLRKLVVVGELTVTEWETC